MPRDFAIVPMTALADSPNTPDTATVVHIFIDTTNNNRLAAKMSDGSVKPFEANGDPVELNTA